LLKYLAVSNAIICWLKKQREQGGIGLWLPIPSKKQYTGYHASTTSQSGSVRPNDSNYLFLNAKASICGRNGQLEMVKTRSGLLTF
jgi:hypothetical protein